MRPFHRKSRSNAKDRPRRGADAVDAWDRICQHDFLLSRMLLILILAASLPARGYAASVMMLCGAAGQGSVMSGSASGSHNHATEHAGHASQAPDAGSSHPVDDGGGHSGSHDHQSSTCSVCSVCGACCVGLLSASFIATSPSGVVTSGPIAFFDHRAAGFIPGTLDRPPLPVVL